MGYNKIKGAWEFPGGKLDNKDNSTIGCGIRELLEETGIDLGHTDVRISLEGLIEQREHLVVLYKTILPPEAVNTIFKDGLHDGLFRSTDTVEYASFEHPLNPEENVYAEWRWFCLDEFVPDKVTWVAESVLWQVVGVKCDPNVTEVQPNPFVAA
jgi:8-oxo-dGTP pyrophosphatase MutT (NUDIX family)